VAEVARIRIDLVVNLEAAVDSLKVANHLVVETEVVVVRWEITNHVKMDLHLCVPMALKWTSLRDLHAAIKKDLYVLMVQKLCLHLEKAQEAAKVDALKVADHLVVEEVAETSSNVVKVVTLGVVAVDNLMAIIREEARDRGRMVKRAASNRSLNALPKSKLSISRTYKNTSLSSTYSILLTMVRLIKKSLWLSSRITGLTMTCTTGLKLTLLLSVLILKPNSLTLRNLKNLLISQRSILQMPCLVSSTSLIQLSVTKL